MSDMSEGGDVSGEVRGVKETEEEGGSNWIISLVV